MSRMTLDRLPPELANADNLPTPPTVALQVMKLAEDPKAQAEDLGELIRLDPALTVRLLRTVNSPANGLPRTIDSVERACALLGFRKAKTLAMGFAVADSLPTVGPDSGFDLDEYWLRSGIAATASELFATRILPNNADVAFVVGLLSEVGRLLLAGCMTSVYKTVLEKDRWPSTQLERESLGFSNLEISSTLFRNWSLPDEIVEPIAFRDDAENLPSGLNADTFRLTRILAAAESLAQAWAGGTEGRGLRWAGDAAMHYLNVPAEQFVEIVEEIREKVESRSAFASVSPPSNVDVRSIEQQACERLKEAVSRSSSGSRVADLLRAAQG